jgi:uncharacterized membrane protein
LTTVCRRGLEIFVLAFLFRLQAFLVSPGSYPVMVFRVDVLNVMGPAMVAAAVLWAIGSPRLQVAAFTAATIAVAMATPIVRAARFVDALPTWFQWYLRPAGDYTAFTLFPWAAFVFAGAAVGALLPAAADRDRDRSRHLALGLAGAALIAVGVAAAQRPSIYTVPSAFWTSSPAWFAMRVGILTLTLAALRFVPPRPAFAPLAVLGRASLFVYWIHVELVYGYASWLWRHRLPVWAWLPALAAFTALMYRAIGWRDRLLSVRSRGISGAVPMPQA